MKRVLIGFGGVLLLAANRLLHARPGIIERQRNQIDGQPLPQVTPEARRCMQRSRWWTCTATRCCGSAICWTPAERGHIDLPRLQEGNVALQVFSSVTKTPKNQNYDSNTDETDNITLLAIAQLQPVRTWSSLLERTLWHGEKLARAAEASDGQLALVRTSADIVPVRAPDADEPPVAAHAVCRRAAQSGRRY